ncbi:MAG: MTAP family purine nucleoside phosphorylase [Proteobacteria bacterium]|nr:MTAP family purine nucleoside phosphorylase [Pseudomonadota bacterium]
MNGIIGGTSLLNSSIFASWDEQRIETPYGDIYSKIKENTAFIQRHGSPLAPPHLINHKANIWALKNLDVKKILSVNSVGSLKIKLKPGTFVIPDDFISLWNISTFFDKEMKFIVPQMHEGIKEYIAALCKELRMHVHSGGVYIQTIGPRLETKAEIGFLKQFGDIVGMTMASEATLCMEYEIPYASLCSVDNYCHGIIKVPLTMEEINRNWQNNMKEIEAMIKTIIEKDFS